MAKQVHSSFIKSSLLALLLAGCVQEVPYSITVTVFNEASVVSDEAVAPMACSGGVQASLSLTGASVTTPLALPSSVENDSGRENLIVPPSTRFGAPFVTEAWCYDEADNEIGYVEVDRPLRPGNIPTVLILAPLAAEPTFEDADGCIAPTEQRGVELCVKSDLY